MDETFSAISLGLHDSRPHEPHFVREEEAMSERTTIMKKVRALSVFVLMVFAWISEPAIAQPYDDPLGVCLPEPNPTGAGCWDY